MQGGRKNLLIENANGKEVEVLAVQGNPAALM